MPGFPDHESLGGEVGEHLRRLEAALRDLAGGEGAPPEFDADLFLAPGVPRIRPLLVLLSARAAGASPGGPSESAPDRTNDSDAQVHVAASAELLHLAIRMHDAALGRQGGRRRRAARRLLGGAVGWLGGNHLSLRALELARHAPAPEVIGDLLDAMREVGEGHALAQSVQGRVATSDECIAHAEGHTGAVFAFACRAGARVAGADRPVVTGLGRYGRHAGVAWHLAEDLAAMSPNASDGTQAREGGDEGLARSIETRAATGRPVLPVSIAIERDPDAATHWKRLGRGPNAEAAGQVAKAVRRTGALGAGRERLALETWSARQALGAVGPSPWRDSLDGLAAALAK